MRLLWALDHGLRSVSKQMHIELGVTGPQRLVLRLVGRFGEVSPSQLAELLHLDRGTLTGIIERLVARQLLLRAPHPTDGRRSLLRLSARGRRFDREMPGTVEYHVRRALAALPAARVAAAKQVLEAVLREVDPSALAGEKP
jgi:MarR family transcriptional regulator, organic hydroperoxide resistance regulator